MKPDHHNHNLLYQPSPPIAITSLLVCFLLSSSRSISRPLQALRGDQVRTTFLSPSNHPANTRNAAHPHPSSHPSDYISATGLPRLPMATFMQTMFVATSPPRPRPCLPLQPIQTNILAEPESSTHNLSHNLSHNLQLQWPGSPQSVYQDPLQKQFRDVLDHSPTQSAGGARTQQYLRNNYNAMKAAVGVGGHLPDPVASIYHFGQGYTPPRQGRHGHAQGQQQGLGFGLDSGYDQADLFSRSSNANARTRAAFKPTQRPKGTNSWQLKQFAEATLGSGSLRKVVQLPEGEDKDEWIAVNGTCQGHGLLGLRWWECM